MSISEREREWEKYLEVPNYEHIQKSIFVVPIYQEVSLEALLWPVHWHVFVEAIVDIYLCCSRTVFLKIIQFIATSELDISVLTPSHTFLDNFAEEKKLLYLIIVDLYIRINLYDFYLKYLFRHFV